MAEFSIHNVTDIKVSDRSHTDPNITSQPFRVFTVTVTDGNGVEHGVKFFTDNLELEISND
jgi:hypothetical protein